MKSIEFLNILLKEKTLKLLSIILEKLRMEKMMKNQTWNQKLLPKSRRKKKLLKAKHVEVWDKLARNLHHQLDFAIGADSQDTTEDTVKQKKRQNCLKWKKVLQMLDNFKEESSEDTPEASEEGG